MLIWFRRKGKVFRIVITGLVFLGSEGFASPIAAKIPVEHNEVLGLNKLEALLRERNSSLEISRLRTRSIETDTKQKEISFGPTFHSRYTYHPQSDNFQDAHTSSIHRGDFFISYPLLDSVWRREYEIKTSISRQEESSIRTRMLQTDLLYRLRTHYLSALEAAKLAEGFRKAARDLSNRTKPLKILIEAQEALPVDLLELEKLIMEADISRLKQEKKRIQTRNAIATLIHLDPKSFLLPETDPLSWGNLPKEEELIEWACRKHSELALFSARLMQEEASYNAYPYRFFRLDAIAGYTVEEDRIGGFESGSQFGLHLQIPFSYQKLVKQRRMQQFFNKEVLRKEIYARQIATRNRIASIYEDLAWLKKKEKLIYKDTERLREILRIARLRHKAYTGERRIGMDDIYKTEYQLWLTGAEKIRLHYNRMHNFAQLLRLVEIPHFDQMRKIQEIRRKKLIKYRKR